MLSNAKLSISSVQFTQIWSWWHYTSIHYISVMEAESQALDRKYPVVFPHPSQQMSAHINSHNAERERGKVVSTM